MSVYLGEWESKADVFRDFEVEEAEQKDIEIVIAYYGYEYYDGYAYVLFRRGDKLYDVEGSHCSCYGLEDQWSPVETNDMTIMNRVKNGSYAHTKKGDEDIKAKIVNALFLNYVEEELSKDDID